MGTVYVAHDPVLGRMVAVKVFAGDLDVPDARERFSREARASAAERARLLEMESA